MGFDSLKENFVMTDDDFVRICEWVKEHTGIKITEAKRQMVFSRLTKRLRSLGFDSFKDYLDFVEMYGETELVHFKNAITTNLTAFFREPHHFEYLRETILPHIKANSDDSKEVRIWSAGCSTGEEAYSIAIILNKILPQALGWDVKVLATDIDTNVLQRAREGIYHVDRISEVDERLSKGAFIAFGGDSSLVRVADQLKEIVVFNQLNLMVSAWPMKRKFDVIFCRNVMIYFHKDTQRELIGRYADLLKSGGYLMIGHSESLLGVSDSFELVGKNMYKKKV